MKKIISLISAMSVASMLVACGGAEASSVPSLPSEQISEQTSTVVSSESIVSSSLEEDGYLSTGPFYAGYYSDEMIELAVGDTYNGLTLKELFYRPEGRWINDSEFETPDETAVFTGEIKLKGEIYVSEITGVVAIGVYINLDEESANQLPYPAISRGLIADMLSTGNYEKPVDQIFLQRHSYDIATPTESANEEIDLLTDITGLTEANGIPCEITISEITFKYVHDIITLQSAVLKDFKQL